MSAEPTTPLSTIPDDVMRQALVAICHLSPDVVEVINESAEKLQLSFVAAALQAGAVSREELEDAVEWVQRREMKQGRGIVEEVLRRAVRRSHALVLWEGPKLLPSTELAAAQDPAHARGEALRGLRTELHLRMKRHGARTVAVLSPSAAEGRSRLAGELAIAFAQLGRRTLLVDADLRRPRQHVLFGAANDTGLAVALLDGSAPRLHAVEGLPQMALITSGPVPQTPLELLSGPYFEKLMREWRRSFEVVVLDTPPVTEFSDAIAVATAAENVLVAGRNNQTSFDALKEMCRRIETTRAQILGAVLNKF